MPTRSTAGPSLTKVEVGLKNQRHQFRLLPKSNYSRAGQTPTEVSTFTETEAKEHFVLLKYFSMG